MLRGSNKAKLGYGRVDEGLDENDNPIIKAPKKNTKALAAELMNMFKPADQKLMRICKETGDVKALASLLRRKKLDVNHADQVCYTATPLRFI